MENPHPLDSNRRRFVVLDRDGTIIVERHYLSDPVQVELLSGAAAGLNRLSAMGFGLVVITNQSAIGRGYFDLRRLDTIHQRFRDLLENEGVHLAGIYFCPHIPQDECQCRKPRTGLVEEAARDLGFEPTECFVVGDKESDIKLGKSMGATTFLVSTGYGSQVSRNGAANPDYVSPDYYVAGLTEVAEVIQSLLPQTSRI